MQLLSIYFLIFFFIFLLGYYFIPAKYRYIAIFIGSISFYTCQLSSFFQLVVFFSVLLIVWAGTICLARISNKSRLRRLVFYLSLCLGFLPLFVFKYGPFFSSIISNTEFKGLNSYIPVGLSFFTLQATGYLIDVYRGDTEVDVNPIRFGAYVAFFPTILSGPIERSNNLLKQLQQTEEKPFQFEDLKSGGTLFLWGAFVKLIVADRLSVLVNTVYGSYQTRSSFIVLFAVICYSIQIYCDFYSYSLMAIGTGRMLGIRLINNFDTPYFSCSVQEFWRRWHISLSTWFRDYVYIPLGGNRCSKLRKNINLMITFLVSGLWHGANWTFVIWGGIHGIFQIIGGIIPKEKKNRIDGVCRKIGTFILITFAWIFFRADTIGEAFGIIRKIFSQPALWDALNGSLYTLGLDTLEMNILGLGLILVFAIDHMCFRDKCSVDVLLNRRGYLFQCFILISIFIFVLVFGRYGQAFDAQEFIYFQF